MDFWENILRLPRFFITSFLGLILIILNPLIEEIKNNKVLVIFIVFAIIGIIILLSSMLGLFE